MVVTIAPYPDSVRVTALAGCCADCKECLPDHTMQRRMLRYKGNSVNKLSGLLLAAVGVLAVSGAALADSSDSKVVIKNKSAWAIHELYFSPTEEREWGEDQLGAHTINTGDTFTLNGIPCRAYDVRLVDEDGDELVADRRSGKMSAENLRNVEA